MIKNLSATFNWLRMTKPIIMMARKIKQQTVDSNLASKLRSSNIYQNFDPKPESEKLQFISKIRHNKYNDNNVDKISHKQINNQISIQDNAISKEAPKQKTRKNTNYLKDHNQARNKKKNVKNLVEIEQTSGQSNLPDSMRKNITLNSALTKLGHILDPLDPKQLRNRTTEQVAIIENQQQQQALALMKQLDLKDFSILAHKLLVNSSGHNGTLQKFVWKQIQQDFLNRFQITNDPNKIRSYSKIIYSLSKSKIYRSTSLSTVNTSVTTNLQSFQTKFAILLPSCTHQSFTTIITSLSRMGPLSEQFSYISERLYYSKYNQFNARQRVQINYALTRNGRQVDKKLYQYIDSMNLKQIVTMLRCYQNCNQLYDFKPDSSSYANLLSFAQKHIIARKDEMNVIDIGQICNICFQATTDSYKISPELEKILTQMYKILKRNINEVAFEKIWKYLPNVVNRGFLQVEFVEQIMKTLQIMRKKNIFPQRIWKPLRQSFAKFENLQLRTRLQKIK